MIESIALLFYTAAFLGLFLLRRPLWLAAGVAAAGLVLALLYAFAQSISGEAALGPAILFYVISFGFAVGVGARLAVMAAGRWSKRKWLETLIGLAFCVGAPALMIGWSKVQQERTRARYAPPSLECKTRLHDARLGDRIVRLPLVWGIQVAQGPTPAKSISFYAQEKAREFCEATQHGKPRLTLVRIDLPQLESGRETLQPICRIPRAEPWWPALCRHEARSPIDLYSIALFDPARFDSATYLSFSVEPPGADRASQGPRWQRDGPFMRATNGRDIYWRGPARDGAASAYLARCYEDLNARDRPDGLRCKAGYRLSPGVGLVYDFRVDGTDFVPEALRQDERVSAVARSLLAP